ncbi:unnamed protein product [Auanema sp. JU1783]|nr:unnamed protein product [Auanema sp. JU1783]
MKWYCFLFWFFFRLTLACLAHFNWAMAVYTNCIYFPLWKSYDLLWFWMHLILCTCFPQLRPENFLIVWTNMIFKKLTKYPNMSFKQIYLTLYGSSKYTKAEMSLQRMETVERKERESRRLRKITEGHSSSEEEDNNSDVRTNVESKIPEINIEENNSEDELMGNNDESVPVAPPRKNQRVGQSTVSYSKDNSSNGQDKVSIDVSPENESEESGNESDSSTSKWIKRVPDVIRNRFRKTPSSPDASKLSAGENIDTVSVSTWTKIKGIVPNPLKFNRSSSSDSAPNEIYVLRPDFTNTFDCLDPIKAAQRAKRDRKELIKKVRARVKAELKVAAEKEKRRKKVTDSIELLLQLLRMIASFMILVGNIRKTFIPAQFRYLKPGQHPYDNYELLLIFRVTTFLDISMFWTNIMWVYCLQWHLCIRLGFCRFWAWLSLLATIALLVMIIPMAYAMDQMDLSWCVFVPESPLHKYQPTW